MNDSAPKYGIPHPESEDLEREHRPRPEDRVFNTRQEEAVRGMAGEVAQARMMGYADPELEQVVTWALTLSSGLQLEVVDWVPKDEDYRGMVAYSEPLLRITPMGGKSVDVQGPDVDALLLVIKQVRPDHAEPFRPGGGIHPAMRRKAMKVLKHDKAFKNKKP